MRARQNMITFLIVLLANVPFLDSTIGYVKPSENGSTSICPACPCEVLEYYATNPSIMNSTSTLILLNGVHTLNSTFAVLTSITLMADNVPAIIMCKNDAGFHFVNITSLTISKLIFQYCGSYFNSRKSALMLVHIFCLELLDVQVLNSSGFGVVIRNTLGTVRIKDSTFQYNKGSSTYAGGNVYVEYNECFKFPDQLYFEIISSNFSYGNALASPNILDASFATGLSLIFNSSCTNSTVFMKNVTMEGNSNSITNGIGGNLFIHFYDTYQSYVHIDISDSRFVNGKARFGGGVGITVHHNTTNMVPLQNSSNTINITSSDISFNNCVTGCGLYIEVAELVSQDYDKVVISLKNATILNNRAENSNYSMGHNIGVAVFILNGLVQIKTTIAAKIILDNITVSGSTTKQLYSASADSAAILISQFMGHLTLLNSEISNNNVSGISLVNSKITLFGKLLIANNHGVNGGGIIICGVSYITLAPKVKITRIKNTAKTFGGAIYANTQCRDSHSICLYQFLTLNSTNMDDKYLTKVYKNSFKLESNTAGIAGQHVYAENIANCLFYRSNLKFLATSQLFYKIFQVPHNFYGNYSAVTSDPFKVCTCVNNNNYNCSLRVIEHNDVTYPGKTINIAIIIVGQLDGAVPGSVLINGILHMDINNTQYCSMLPITAKYNMSEYFLSVLYNKFPLQTIGYHLPIDSSPLVVQVNDIDHCPVGFILQHNVCQCDYSNTGIKDCNINNLTIAIKKGSWVGYNNIINHQYQPEIIYHKVCPLDYCNDSNAHIVVGNSTMQSDMQCSDYRTGLLCGSCKINYSVVVGSTRCVDCRKKHKVYAVLVTVLLILASLLLIILMAWFDVYVTNGTLSGLLFYVNILYGNNTLFKFTGPDILTVIVAVMNLDTGIESCFYDGMDTYAKTWFQLLIPIFFWLEIMCIIVISRRSDRIARLIGYNAPKILATLIELSFNRALRACISSLSYTSLDFPSYNNKTRTRYVWLYNANVDYLQGKHIPLFIAGGLVSSFLLTYTCVLLFVQPLQRYSHVYCLRWVNRLKPIIDAYTAPNIVKTNCQFWGGLLLLTRVCLSIYAAVNFHNEPTNDMVAIATTCLLLSTVAFATGGVYQSARLNTWNAIPILNLGLLSILTELVYINNSGQSKHSQHHHIIVYTSASITISMTVGLTLYCVIKKMIAVFKKVYRKCYTHKAKAVSESKQLLNISQESVCHSRLTH